MLVINKHNRPYIEGKKKRPVINLEGYDNFASQLKEAAENSKTYRDMVKKVNLGFVLFEIPSLLFGFYVTIQTLYLCVIIFFDVLNHPLSISGLLINFVRMTLGLLISWFLLQVFWGAYVTCRTRVDVYGMKRLIRRGTMVTGCVDTAHIIHGGKRKIRGRKKISIEYTFTAREGETMRGFFTTSKVKAVTSGDEIAVWYVNKFLHILL